MLEKDVFWLTEVTSINSFIRFQLCLQLKNAHPLTHLQLITAQMRSTKYKGRCWKAQPPAALHWTVG